MSVTLAVVAILAGLTAILYALWPSLFHGPAPEAPSRRPSPRPPVRPAVRPAGPWWPQRVGQVAAAEAADRPSLPLTDKERQRFDDAVAAFRKLAAVRPETTSEEA